MTNNEAQQQAEEILLCIKQIMQLTQDKPRKLFAALNELLEDVQANRLGLTEPEAPMATPWAMYDCELITILLTKWLPAVTGRRSLTKDELVTKHLARYIVSSIEATDCVSGYLNNDAIV